jgi:transcriptional regulator with XRE-family HTH domain
MKASYSRADLAELFRRRMQRRGLNRQELAQFLGVTESAVCRFMKGSRPISGRALDWLGFRKVKTVVYVRNRRPFSVSRS